MATSDLIIQGARSHTLKNIDVTIPRQKLCVITGVSGSGKSSLAFDTIYAEGQRRYVESLSAYARQFLDRMQKPDVDRIEGLSPAISIEQKTTSKNPRSTVGTITEVYDYLRLLFARIGIPYSPATGKPIQSQTLSQMVDRVMLFPEGTKLYLMAPISRGRKGTFQKEAEGLMRQGYQRFMIDGKEVMAPPFPTLDKKKAHTIDVVIDRVVIKPHVKNRLAESLETVLKVGQDLAITMDVETGKRHLFSAVFACPESGFTLPEIEPRLFSFNSPFGACETCDGLGHLMTFDETLLVAHPDKTLDAGAIPLLMGPYMGMIRSLLKNMIRYKGESSDMPYHDLSDKLQKLLMDGSGKENVPHDYFDAHTKAPHKPFMGLKELLKRRYTDIDSPRRQEEWARYQTQRPCPACHGKRLKPEALCVKVHQKTIADVTSLSLKEAQKYMEGIMATLDPSKKAIATPILREIQERLRFLVHVGLGYLTLARASGTLSGGETQRIRLASQIGSGLTGVLYVLDEPSIGLHQRDNDRLLETLKRLRDLGNSVIVVEHDEDTIRAADFVVDMGPGAGQQGGEIVTACAPTQLLKHKKSLTAAYLRGDTQVDMPKKRPISDDMPALVLKGACHHNLKNVTARFPLGRFIAVTGVSGGGKSTLVLQTLYRALAARLHGSKEYAGRHDTLEGWELIDKIIDIDQSPIGRTPRSNPATYTGVFTPIREWFASLPLAKARGYGPGRFSFNVKGGRCEACQGDGVTKIEMHFLPDVYVTCDVCQGKRYNRETCDVTYKNHDIADILAMTIDAGVDFFKSIPSIYHKLITLQEVGLGYCQIGHRATALSGGEAQRVKLSKELSRRATGKTVYILDEPTTGLHFHDVKQLLKVLHRLVDQGNTLIVIEHNLDVIKTADWVIDLGPEGGDGGGKILAQMPPEDLAQHPTSQTGPYLRRFFDRPS